MTIPIRLSAASACLFVTCSALADWTPTADFSSCPRKYYPQLTGHDPPVATESECKAQIERAKRGDAAVCIRYSCVEGASGSGSGASSSAPGHQLDSNIEQAISAGVSGQISGADAVGLVSLGVLGNALLAGMSPEQQQQQQQQAEAQRQQLAAQERQRAMEEEERKNRLLGEMQGVDSGGELGLMMGDDNASTAGGNSSGGGNELALMSDDDERGIMGKRKPPKQLRNRPPATRINPGPYTPGAGPKVAVARAAPAEPNRQRRDQEQPAERPPLAPDSFNRGVLDAQACTQRNPAPLCGNLAPDVAEGCRKRYDEGYNRGAREHETQLTAQGTAAGQRDRARQPPQNVAMSYPEARGSCGNIFVRAYNDAMR